MNRVVIALAVSELTAGSALASDKDDIMGVLKQWISGEVGTHSTKQWQSANRGVWVGRRLLFVGQSRLA